MAPRWTPSAGKHNIPQADIAYAIQNASFAVNIEDPPTEQNTGSVSRLFIGPQHSGTQREIEVLIRLPSNPGEPVSIYHAMPLGPKFRRLREESQNDHR